MAGGGAGEGRDDFGHREMMMENIEKQVHDLYYGQDANCARTTLLCLSGLFDAPIERQTMAAAVGMHGAGGFRAQCGLVEGGLMFIGIYCDHLGKTEEEAVDCCYHYAEAFRDQFHSLRCRELRPTGFSPDDPPHMCEGLTCEAIEFTCHFIQDNILRG